MSNLYGGVTLTDLLVDTLTVLKNAGLTNLTVSNNTTLSNLTVTGQTNLQGNLNAQSNLIVSGRSTFNSNVTVIGGQTTLGGVSASGLTSLTGPVIMSQTAQINNLGVMSNLTVRGTSNLNGNVLIGAPNIDLINLHLLGNLIVDINTTVANLTNEIMFTRELNFEPGAPPPTLFQGTIVDSPIVDGATFDIGGTYSLVLANASVSSSMNTFAFVVTSVPGMLSLGQATLTYTTLGGVTSYSSIVSLGGHQYRVTFSAPSGNFQTADRMYIYVTFTQYG
jgi:hypothetical protein